MNSPTTAWVAAAESIHFVLAEDSLFSRCKGVGQVVGYSMQLLPGWQP